MTTPRLVRHEIDDDELRMILERLERIFSGVDDTRKALEDLCQACALLPGDELARMHPQLDRARKVLFGEPPRHWTGGRS